MLSLIDVKCPHCGAQGQIVTPPMGSIIIGPCPECQGTVAIFCGTALALDKEIMLRGKAEEKREHLMEVLGMFLHDRVERLFEEREVHEEFGGVNEEPHMLGPLPMLDSPPKTPITPAELETFTNIDLCLIDNKEYFKAVFG